MGKRIPALTLHSATWIPKERLKRPFTNLTDSDGRVSEIEELVHTGKKDFPNTTTQARKVDDGIAIVHLPCLGRGIVQNGLLDMVIHRYLSRHASRLGCASSSLTPLLITVTVTRGPRDASQPFSLTTTAGW